MIIPALDRDGKEITVEFIDRGRDLPGFDKRGNRIEVYTSQFRVGVGEWTFVQVDARLLDRTAARGGPVALAQRRMAEDFAAMVAAGIEAHTLDFDRATP